MTERRIGWVAIAGLLLVGLVWWRWPTYNTTDKSSFTTSRPPPGSSPAGSPGPTAPVEEVSHLADDLNSPGGEIRTDLRILSDILATFRTNFPHDGNPVGNNAEITAALSGKNRLHLALIPPHHAAINAAGELCDRWGTPFFFHAESGTHMAIRSAGPDKKMWTDDDVVFSP